MKSKLPKDFLNLFKKITLDYWININNYFPIELFYNFGSIEGEFISEIKKYILLFKKMFDDYNKKIDIDLNFDGTFSLLTDIFFNVLNYELYYKPSHFSKIENLLNLLNKDQKNYLGIYYKLKLIIKEFSKPDTILFDVRNIIEQNIIPLLKKEKEALDFLEFQRKIIEFGRLYSDFINQEIIFEFSLIENYANGRLLLRELFDNIKNSNLLSIVLIFRSFTIMFCAEYKNLRYKEQINNVLKTFMKVKNEVFNIFNEESSINLIYNLKKYDLVNEINMWKNINNNYILNRKLKISEEKRASYIINYGRLIINLNKEDYFKEVRDDLEKLIKFSNKLTHGLILFKKNSDEKNDNIRDYWFHCIRIIHISILLLNILIFKKIKESNSARDIKILEYLKSMKLL